MLQCQVLLRCRGELNIPGGWVTDRYTGPILEVDSARRDQRRSVYIEGAGTSAAAAGAAGQRRSDLTGNILSPAPTSDRHLELIGTLGRRGAGDRKGPR